MTASSGQPCLAAAPLLLAVLTLWVRVAAGARIPIAPGAAASPAASPTAATGSAEDAALLLAFKASLDNGDQLLENWRAGTDPCAWTGISCTSTGAVDSIVLTDKGLRGTIPWPDGWKLPPTTRDISLGNTQEPYLNQIQGPLPPNWELPPGLTLLYLAFLPIGGTIPQSLGVPSTLQFLLIESANLTGPLPRWPLPAVQSVNLIGNQLTGGFPAEWTQLESLAIMNLNGNRLSGPLPASMTFNQSFGVNALSVDGNNFSGPAPSWPNQPTSILTVLPGNEGVCGQIPAAPSLLEWTGTGGAPVNSLPPCPGQSADSSSSSGLSGGAIAGVVVGCVAGLAIVLAGAAWVVRRRRKGELAAQSSVSTDGGSKYDSKPGMSSLLASWLPPVPPGNPPNSHSQPASGAPFNPFAAGPPKANGSDPSTALGSNGSSGNRSVPLSALRSGGSGGGSSTTLPATQQAKLQAKLQALRQERPAWLISPSRLTLEQSPEGQLVLLGTGAYARVFKGLLQPEPAAASQAAAEGSPAAPEHAGLVADGAAAGAAPNSSGSTQTPLPVALKVMDVADIGAFIQEAALLTRLAGGPHVVGLHGACVDGQQLIVVMELMEGGDLRTVLCSEAPPEWSTGGRQIALDIAEGLVYLHARNVTHRDLKSKNVLMTTEGRAKISDVGTAALHSATFMSAGSSNFGGTLAWSAPELLLGAPISHKSDIYSMGVVLWELVTKRVPRRGDVVPPPPSDACPAGLSQLIADCLRQEPAQRPNAAQVLERLKAL